MKRDGEGDWETKREGDSREQSAYFRYKHLRFITFRFFNYSVGVGSAVPLNANVTSFIAVKLNDIFICEMWVSSSFWRGSHLYTLWVNIFWRFSRITTIASSQCSIVFSSYVISSLFAYWYHSGVVRGSDLSRWHFGERNLTAVLKIKNPHKKLAKFYHRSKQCKHLQVFHSWTATTIAQTYEITKALAFSVAVHLGAFHVLQEITTWNQWESWCWIKLWPI